MSDEEDWKSERAIIKKWTEQQMRYANYIYSILERRRDHAEVRRPGEVEGRTVAQLCHEDWIKPKKTLEVLELMHSVGLVSRHDLMQNGGLTYQLRFSSCNPWNILHGSDSV